MSYFAVHDDDGNVLWTGYTVTDPPEPPPGLQRLDLTGPPPAVYERIRIRGRGPARVLEWDPTPGPSGGPPRAP